MAFVVQAEAHGAGSSAPAPGLQIAGLTHGQMAVIGRYRNKINALAAGQTETDPTFRRLLNHGNLQYTYCLWGLMPGSLTDEQSPFNECGHAYLSASKALLDHMLTMPAARETAAQLVSRIDADMVRSGASWIVCQFSGETFSTGAIVEPRWPDIFFHVPSLLASIFMGGLLLTLIALIFRPFSLPGTTELR